MAMIDVVSYDGSDQEFIWRFPSDNLRLGTQLVVRQAQTAFFVRGGRIYDQFDPGTYTLSSGNIPLLTAAISIPFGGKSPFKAEVWYVSAITKLNNRWGTTTPIQIEDPIYHVVVPVRAYGQYGLRVKEPRRFLESLVGTQRDFSAAKLVDYFTGAVVTAASSKIAQKLVLEKVSVMQAGAYLSDLSNFCQQEIDKEFDRFGLRLENFFVMSINIPEDDPSLVKLKEAKELAMRVGTVGKDIWQMDRSFDVMDKAASNPGVEGSIVGAGLGLGLGVGLGSAMGGQMGGVGSALSVGAGGPPPLPGALSSPPAVSYYIGVAGERKGPLSLSQLSELIRANSVVRTTLVWKQGMDTWGAAESLPELRNYLDETPPPLP